MRVGYIIFCILTVSCGEPDSKPQVVADLSKEKAEIIFAREAGNGQYCVYANSVDKKLLPTPWGELVNQQEAGEQTNQATPNELRVKGKLDFSKVAEGSTLLTERSVSSKDLYYPLVGNSKHSNIASKASYLPYVGPFVLACMLSPFFPAAYFVCTPFLLSVLVVAYIVPIRAKKAAAKEGQNKLNALLLTDVYNWPSLLPELRKIFRWLESENSIECPSQPRITP